MTVTVRLVDGTEDVNVRAADFALGEDGTLSLIDKPVDDGEADEIAVYASGQWIRARTDAAPPSA